MVAVDLVYFPGSGEMSTRRVVLSPSCLLQSGCREGFDVNITRPQVLRVSFVAQHEVYAEVDFVGNGTSSEALHWPRGLQADLVVSVPCNFGTYRIWFANLGTLESENIVTVQFETTDISAPKCG